MTTQHAIDLVQAKAAVISQKIEEVFFTVRSMAHVLAQTQNPGSDLDIRRKHVNTMLKACLEKNLGLTRIYTCWEPDAFDALDVNYVNTKGHDGTGRFIPCWERQANGRMRLLPMPFYNNEDQSDSGQRLGEFYLHPRETKKECILESGSPTGSRTISLVVPIMAHNSFYGITGIDITSDFLQTLVNNLYADEDTGTWQLISHHHTILGHTQQPQLIGSRALDLSDQDAQDPSIKHHDNVIVNNHRSLLSVQIPIPIGQTETPWYVRWEIPYNQIHAEVNTYLWHQIGSGGICIFMTLLLLTLMINRLTRPMRNIITEITESHDDLTHRLHIKSKDELGELAQWINRFIDKVHSMIKHISENSTILAGAAQELSVTSTQMAQSTSKMSDDSAIVTTSVKDMSHNMDQVSQASDQMSNNIKSAAASIEELTANVSEIANNAEEAAGVATQPMNLTEMSNNKMNELVGAANEVGKVVEVIQDIAEQTNLLALNATIEAARAGDAGKGFGVVANEVKELARQTAEATEDITRMISGIQDTTGDSVKAIHRIQKVINEVNDVSNAIATAVEQQSITTREISNNVSHTARASETVAKGLSESATVGREITTNIANVDETATMSAEAATQTRRASEELLELSKQLTNLVSGFKI